MSIKWLLIIAATIAATLLTISFFADDIMPFIYTSGALTIINIFAYVFTNNKKI